MAGAEEAVVKVSDLMTEEKFMDLLAQADDRKKEGEESAFLHGLTVKFDQYGDDMFISDKQASWLQDIAGRAL
jgi:hypothetical protein